MLPEPPIDPAADDEADAPLPPLSPRQGPIEFSVRIKQEGVRLDLYLAHNYSDYSRSLIQKAIESYIADFADVQVALDRLRNPKDPVISSHDLRKSLGL